MKEVYLKHQSFRKPKKPQEVLGILQPEGNFPQGQLKEEG